jgi:hypothetical protein
MIIKNIILCHSITQQCVSDFHTSKPRIWWGGVLACASVQERVGGSTANRRASQDGQACTEEPDKVRL